VLLIGCWLFFSAPVSAQELCNHAKVRMQEMDQPKSQLSEVGRRKHKGTDSR
jgi:hypothetical protein